MKKLILICLMLINTIFIFGENGGTTTTPSDSSSSSTSTEGGTGVTADDGIFDKYPFPPDFVFPEGELPVVPIFPDIPTTGKDVDEYGQIRLLEKTYTVMLESKMNVFVPLEIITDIDIEQDVIGDQIVDVPFEIELNREPEKKDYYSIKYSENLIDIDQDGVYDTYIYSPTYINERVSKDNFVRIYGGNISKEGTHKKDIYLTVEVGG